MDKMFLVEKGQYVVIRDGALTVAFESFSEFNRYYPGIDLTGKWYIDYEPERNLFIDSVLGASAFELIPEYDVVIADIDTLIEKKQDIYFGKTPEEAIEITKRLMVQAVQGLLDTTAQARNYDGILSAASYVMSTNTRFRSEGQACVEWRDSVWSACYQIMSDVENGLRGIPTIEGLLSEMPVMIWPQ